MVALSHEAMLGSRPLSRDGVSFMSRYPGLQSPGTEAESVVGSYDGDPRADAPRMSLSQLSSQNAQAADEVQFHKMVVPPNAGTGAAKLQDESMIFARHNSELALQNSTRAKISPRKFVEEFGRSPRGSNSAQWFPKRAPRSKKPNTMLMRFASRNKQLSTLNKRSKQVMTGAPVSRHFPGTAFHADDPRPAAVHANDIAVPRHQAASTDAEGEPLKGPFSPARKLPSRVESRPRLKIPQGGHPGAGSRGTDNAGGPGVGQKGKRLDEIAQQRWDVAWSEFSGSASSMASFSSAESRGTTASFRSTRSRQSSVARSLSGSPEPLYTVQGAPVTTYGGGGGSSRSLGSSLGQSLSMPDFLPSRASSPARSRRLPTSPSGQASPRGVLNEFRRTSAEFSAAAPRISLYDDDGYAAENPLHEGPLDWSELGEFFDAQGSASVSSPTRMRVGLTSAMMRVDTPSFPQRPVSRAVTAAKRADRFGEKAGNRCTTPDGMRRSSAFVASPILAGATREARIDMASPWRSLVKVLPDRGLPNNLDGRSGTGISSSGVVSGVSVATLS